MKKNAILLNTARGPVVDSEALAKALNEERIAAQALMYLKWNLPFLRSILCCTASTLW